MNFLKLLQYANIRLYNQGFKKVKSQPITKNANALTWINVFFLNMEIYMLKKLKLLTKVDFPLLTHKKICNGNLSFWYNVPWIVIFLKNWPEGEIVNLLEVTVF